VPSLFTTHAGVAAFVQESATESGSSALLAVAESPVLTVFVKTLRDCGVFHGPVEVSAATVGGVFGGVTVGV
jgi:hypothetical protein